MHKNLFLLSGIWKKGKMKLVLHLLSVLNILIYMNLLLLAFHSPPTTALHPANENDRLALLAFKDRIVGDPLGVLPSWNKSSHFCNWTGVLCSEKHQGRVTILSLAGQKLIGSLPPHIGNLSFLRQMNLSDNSFKGEIPQQVGRLFRLRILDLTFNNFHGKIPIELQNISKSLQVIQVAGNQLTGSIPPMLGNASSLLKLSLAINNLQGRIPTELGNLLKLQFLQLSLNNLSGEVPLSIYNLSSLYLLSIAKNQLTGRIPSNVGFTLPNLQYFYVPENHFYGEIPASFTNATKLEQLEFGQNNFSGVVPSNLGSLRNLTVLNLWGNQLESAKGEGLGFITSLTNCTNLRRLLLYQNNFKGALPLSIANLSTKLEKFDIGGSLQISGKIPKEIGNWVHLDRLIIATASITSEIPSSIGKLEKLIEIDLFENRISGPIPSSLGNITQLSILQLQDNHLMGLIPPSLGNCSQLGTLHLENNLLFGNIPKELFSLSHVFEFYLSQNSFTGPLPIDVAGGKLINLVQFNISHNKLSGRIPSALGDCMMLEGLGMGDNLFEGGIPPSFNNLKSLVAIDLSNNKLFGEIPKYFQNFKLLQNLNLSFNNFQGELPTGRVFGNASIISVTGNPRLCGGIHQLGLPSCKSRDKKLHHRIMLISITVSCSIFLMVSVLVVFAYKRSKRRASTSKMVQDPKQFPKISYAELSQATNEFSSSNLIGEGSFGSVYKGIMSRDGVLVAVKVLNLKRKEATKSFMVECETLRNIRHRNLIKIITVCSSIDFRGNDFKALVYEFMQNGSLEEWLHPNGDQTSACSLSLIQRLNIAIEVASAIEYLHNYCQPSIVHGDLKPSNILLDEEMVSHVGDFGLAKFLSISQNQSNSMGVKGTIGYVAPEYGMSNKISKSGDVYSFGVLLLELIIGKRPTDSMFKDNFTIHQFIKARLPERVIDIIDPSLLQEVQDAKNSEARNMRKGVGVLESLLAIANIGVACSMESPSERMEMKEAAAKLYTIRDNFLNW